MTTQNVTGRTAVETKDAAEMADNLQRLLSRISNHSAMGDGPYTEILARMQAKLDSLDAQTKQSQGSQPAQPQYAPKPAPEPAAAAPRPAPPRVRVQPTVVKPAPQQPTLETLQPAPADRAWLDGKLNELTRGLTRSFSESTSQVLLPRMLELEARIDAALSLASTQESASVRALAKLDAQIAGMSDGVQSIQAYESRFTGIETQITGLAESQTRNHAALTDTINRTSRREADRTAMTNNPAMTQVTTMLENLTRDRIRSDSQTVSMLDALQQAMIRVLDRLDTMPEPDDMPVETIAAIQPAAAPHASPTSHLSHVPHAAARNERVPNIEPDYEDNETITDLIEAAEQAPPVTYVPPQAYVAPRRVSEAKAQAPDRSQANHQSDERPQRSFTPNAWQNFNPSSRAIAAAIISFMVPLNIAGLALIYASSSSSPTGVETVSAISETSSIDTSPAPQRKLMADPLPTASLPDAPAEPSDDAEMRQESMSPQAAVEAKPIMLEGSELDAGASSTPTNIELPPATVGPLSLRRAAALGDASAQFEVAVRLAEGKGINQNFKQAITWYLRAAAQNFGQAQYRLGTFYERGLGVEKDIARAKVWYRRAAEQGNVKAMHNLAVLSSAQTNGAPDYVEAIRWFNEAATYNLPDSQFNLAVMYEKGLSGKKDDKLAYKWFSIAARNGDSEAFKRREAAKLRLDTTALTDAEAEVATFMAKPMIPLINDARVAGEDWKKRQTASQENIGQL